MALAPVLVTEPAEAVVSTAEAKLWARVDATEDDTMIAAMVSAATAHLEGRNGILGRCLVTQTWRQDFQDWGTYGYLRLPFFGVSAVSVKYSDSDNVEQTVSTDDYQLLEDECGSYVSFFDGFAEPTVYERADAVRVTMTCGFGAASAVPEPIKTAIKLMVSHWYENREAVGASMQEVPLGVQNLVSAYRSIYV